LSVLSDAGLVHDVTRSVNLFKIEIMSRSRIAVVHGIRVEAERVVSLDLRPYEGGSFPAFSAGSHIDLHLPNGMVRSYSLLNAPGEIYRYVIAVLRDPASRGGSSFIHDHLSVGSKVHISFPRNNFSLREEGAHSVFIAGGIGVTPLISMMHRLRQLDRSFEVMYFARSRQNAPFIEDIKSFNVKTYLHFDDEVRALPNLKALLAARYQGASDHYYACGPAPMLDAFVQICRSLEYPNIHIERFSASSSSAPSASAEEQYVVELRRSGKTLVVAPGQSLLDVLMEAKVDIGFSCQEGICGACETEVIEGEPDHRDSVFSPEEHERDRTMMVCVSGSKSKKLVLNL
jgi:ferredoxin-NADP reductase